MRRSVKGNLDILLSRILITAVILIVASWIWEGVAHLWEWYSTTSETNSAWSSVWDLCKRNLSFFVVAYGIVCLHVSGLAELKYEKNFLKAFLLALFLTPPVMMGIYGHRR